MRDNVARTSPSDPGPGQLTGKLITVGLIFVVAVLLIFVVVGSSAMRIQTKSSLVRSNGQSVAVLHGSVDPGISFTSKTSKITAALEFYQQTYPLAFQMTCAGAPFRVVRINCNSSVGH